MSHFESLSHLSHWLDWAVGLGRYVKKKRRRKAWQMLYFTSQKRAFGSLDMQTLYFPSQKHAFVRLDWAVGLGRSAKKKRGQSNAVFPEPEAWFSEVRESR